jgi:hypothetical protein
MLRAAVLVVVAVGCMTPVIPFGEGKTAKQAQRDTMADFAPARLVTETTWKGEITTRKIRVWADNQYRAQNLDWRPTFDRTLELANVVLERTFGLKLVADYRVWERHVPGSTLAQDLAALAAHDPGGDVLAVVGLTTALPLVSATFDDLGMANLGGRHVVLRGYADLEERKLYANAFRDLLPEERELALQQRRDHKCAVVLLHELAHTLGFAHDADPDLITSAHYSHRARTFSAEARETILRALDARLGRAGTATPPAAPAETPASKPGAPLVFHVDAEGQILRDGKVVDGRELDNLLADAHAADPSTEIIIKRARKAPRSAVEPIVSRAAAIGLTRISMTLY